MGRARGKQNRLPGIRPPQPVFYAPARFLWYTDGRKRRTAEICREAWVMRVLGKYLDARYRSHRMAQGSQVALEVQSAEMDTCDGTPVGTSENCLVILYSGYFIFEIKRASGELYSSETAAAIIRDLASKPMIDLDDYQMGLYDACDIRPEGPLEVTVVEDAE
jgi:hypothetical protein